LANKELMSRYGLSALNLNAVELLNQIFMEKLWNLIFLKLKSIGALIVDSRKQVVRGKSIFIGKVMRGQDDRK